MTKMELRLYGAIASAFGLFAVFPYFLPDGMLREHLHENPVAVGALGIVLLFLGGFQFGRASSLETQVRGNQC